ncbi:mitochondrial 37S ribosomal protein bS6m [Aspergillus luchuensis]|uniref:Small ribosomal subunit protein bS6m n=3 Tax=Aspergillus subgen. Circumdati TaxID=2720871 RepID=A0A146FS76_ASPKA|nr:hypothetical protein BO85DRAFT_475285 [Aspergillus piperis CBS 112811]XP_041541054.1 uncharacterized protein AKAW2_30607S [Aspergillus luchuensis]RAH61141.1 hypothetical protein BO85DRAFT_475285 [Aspergillus piperis CBS 112811]BCR97288.1 hypothetical protein AKAW2_30607S [Aspergillus luchuensis]BCS09754.1 hypothetical protein ALUC_30571S [Aspergillus luchuensis]GAT28398.1 37S ribosomal protein Mrp17 [Aspergillus luchuensis]
MTFGKISSPSSSVFGSPSSFTFPDAIFTVQTPLHIVGAMLYELIAVVRPGSLQEVRDIARNAGIQVLRSGGVVRGFTNWGTFRLPRPTTKHQARYKEGHHFIMRFDASGPVQSAVRRTLGLDPRMVRFSVVKLGDKLEEIKHVDGKVEWNNNRTISETF